MILPEKTALLVIDVQNDFCSPQGSMAQSGKNMNQIESTVSNIKMTIDNLRMLGVKIFLIQTIHGTSTNSSTWENRGESHTGVCSNKWGQQFYKIDPENTDEIIVKNRYSAFVGTNLDLILRSQGINHLILVGFTTNVCVESTAREGFMLNYHVMTLSDCTASYNDIEHKSALFNLNHYFGETKTAQEILKIIAI